VITQRYIAPTEVIEQRNSIFAMSTDWNKVFKMVANRHSYVNQRDFSIDKEDLMQELAMAYCLFIDKNLLKGVVIDPLPQMIMRISQNTIVDIIRKIDSQKRGASRLKEKEEIIHLYDVPEEVMATTISDGVLVSQFVEMLEGSDGSSYGVSESDWQLFFDYFINGYTQQEILKRHDCLGYTQQNLSRKLQLLGNIVLPQLKAEINDYIIMENE
jgi:hypothetical protein